MILAHVNRSSDHVSLEWRDCSSFLSVVWCVQQFINICVCKLLCLSAFGAHAHFRVSEWLDPWSSSGSAHSSHPRKVAPPIRRRSDAWRAVSAFTHLCWHGGRHSGVHQWNTFWCQVGIQFLDSMPVHKLLLMYNAVFRDLIDDYCSALRCLLCLKTSYLSICNCFIWNVVTAECSANRTHNKWHIIIINTKNKRHFSFKLYFV